MCGIFGFSHDHEINARLTPTLAIAMEARGKHSWGVTDGNHHERRMGSILDSWEDFGLSAPTYHTRQASVGAISLRNTHPFDFSTSTKRVVGVHNGGVGNWQSLRDKYNRKDLEVDSEHVFMHLAEGKSVAELSTWGATVWYEMDPAHPENRVRYLSRMGDYDNLHVARLKVEDSPLVFASTKDSIAAAARLAGSEVAFFYDLQACRRYLFDRDSSGRMALFHNGRLPWSRAIVVDNTSYWGRPYKDRSTYNHHIHDINTGTGGFSSTGTCPMAACFHKIEDPRSQLICQECLLKLIVENFGENNEFLGDGDDTSGVLP